MPHWGLKICTAMLRQIKIQIHLNSQMPAMLLFNYCTVYRWFGVNVFNTNTFINSTANSETGNTLDKNLLKISHKQDWLQDNGLQFFRFSLDGIPLPNKEWKSLSIVFLFQKTVLTVMCWKEHISLLGKKIEEYIHSLQEEKKINVTQLTSCYF